MYILAKYFYDMDTMNMNEQTLQGQNLAITADELRTKLESQEPIMVLDIGDRDRYERGHIPGSACGVCNEEAKKKIMPELPRDIEIVLVGDDEEHTREMASMMYNEGLKAKYLKGGIRTWKWDLTRGTDTDISANDLKELLDVDRELFLLDVRQPEEFAHWSINGSVNIPLNELSKEDSLKKIPKEKEIVTICSHGNRSKVAKYILSRYGYNVKSLEGGLKAWSTAFEYASEEFEIDGHRVGLIQLRRIGKGCMSYIIESDGEAVVIDPVFPIDDYIRIAKDLSAKITGVYDTHQHADHVSAAKALAEEAGAKLYMSSYEEYAFKHSQLFDGDLHKIGSVKMQVIHTPGHTLGSLSFLIGKKMLLTGDTLFLNGVGRPDLRDRAKEFSPVLHDTLHGKILVLPEDVLIFPAHLDGYVKEGELVTARLADVRKSSLLQLAKEEFVRKVVSMVMPTPPHHRQIIAVNKGTNLLGSVAEIHELEMGPNRCSISTSI